MIFLPIFPYTQGLQRGGETILVDWLGFKPSGWCHAPLGGFDSHSLPPSHRATMQICNLDFPDTLHYHIEHQVWARCDADNHITVGITAMGIQVAGEIYMCRPKPVGTVVEACKSIAVVELAKSIVSVKSPLHGTVLEINPRLAQEPELVHRDPYGEGWIARLQATDWANDSAQLLQGEALIPAMEHYAWLNLIE